MNIDHIGYAVKKIERGISSFEKVGFQFGDVIDDIERNIKICFGIKDGYRIELIQPLDKKKTSPVDVYLDKIGSTPYHICYASEKFDDEICNLQKQGFRIVIEPAEAVAFGGKRVVFMINSGMGLLEIVEK